jgi:D-alanine-D-alanine ligase
MMNLKTSKIAVICGGTSSERQVSLKSGAGIHDALKRAGYDVCLLDLSADAEKDIADTPMDFAFIALHGSYGEDGGIQTLLESKGIPYAGSDAVGCRNAFDKRITREILDEQGIPCPAWREVTSANEAAGLGLRYPVFVKPTRGGSSIGVSLVKTADEMPNALIKAFSEDSRVLIETSCPGREFAVGILGESALPVIEIVPGGEFYDYASKYESSATRYEFPGDLGNDLQLEMQKLAVSTHVFLGCSAFSRVDLMLSGGKIYVLELNTIPGMTTKSLLPKQAAKIGIDYTELCVRMMEESLRERECQEDAKENTKLAKN